MSGLLSGRAATTTPERQPGSGIPHAHAGEGTGPSAEEVRERMLSEAGSSAAVADTALTVGQAGSLSAPAPTVLSETVGERQGRQPASDNMRCEAWCWTHAGQTGPQPIRRCSRVDARFDPFHGADLCPVHARLAEVCLSEPEARERRVVARAEYRARWRLRRELRRETVTA